MQRSGGLVTLQDSQIIMPNGASHCRCNGGTIPYCPPRPPSSGGIALLQLLALRDAITPAFAGLEHNSAPYLHLLAELKKRAFADRAEYLGDPDHVEVPVTALLAPDYLKARAGGIDPTRISSPSTVQPGLESPDTTHFSILDGDGNGVALTYTLNWDFGSGVVVAGAGFLLNNEMDDFSAKPGVPNAFGVIGNERNATRFHHPLPQAYLLRLDQRQISASAQLALEEMGYTVEPNDWGDFGDIQAVQVTDNGIEAAADSRGRGVAQRVTRNP